MRCACTRGECSCSCACRQAQDPESRQNQLGGKDYGHITWSSTPPSRETVLSDVIDLGYAAESIQIADVMDTLSGPFCYYYD